MELRALAWFTQHANMEVSHDDLLLHVWNYAPGIVSRAPYFTVRRLRAKLEVDPNAPVLLQTVHGIGYRYRQRDTATPTSPPARAGNLTGNGPRLLGRDAIRATLEQHLETSSFLGLYGPPGVGKTVLAHATAVALGGEGWLCSLTPSADDDAAAGALLELLGRQPSDGDPLGLVDAVPAMLVDRGPVVVVLDNVSPEVGTSLAQKWTQRLPRLTLITTHLRRPNSPSAFRIPPLSPADGAMLLRNAAAKLGRVLPESDQEHLEELSERLDGLPLSLELIAPRLGLTSTARLVGSSSHLRSSTSLNDTIARAWSDTDSTSQRLLEVCAAFAGGALLMDLVAICEFSVEEVLDGLQDLADRCLVKITDPRPPLDEPRFSVYASIRSFLTRRPGHDAHQDRVREYVADQCWSLYQRARDGERGAYPKLLDESANLEDTLRQPSCELRARVGRDPILRSGGTPEDRWENASRAIALAEETGDPFWISEAHSVRAGATRGALDDTPRDHEAAVKHATSPAQKARASMGLAGHHLGRGRISEGQAHLDTAFTLAQDAGMPSLLHAILQSRLQVAVYRSDTDAADGLVERIRAHRRAHGLSHLPLQNLAIWYDLKGDLPEMRRVLDSDIANHHGRAEHDREANARMNLGYILLQGLDPDALPTLRGAVRLSQRSGNRAVECLARLNLSILLLTQGKLDEANTEGLAARSLADDLRHERYRAKCRLALGQVAAARRDPEAATHLTEATELATQCDDRATIISGQLLLATILYEQGHPDEAAEVWREAVRKTEDPQDAGRFDMAVTYHKALFDLCRGESEAVDQVLNSAPPSCSRSLLCAWVEPRR